MSFAVPGNKLGVTFANELGTIRVYSANATYLAIVILDDENPREIRREIELLKGENDIWSATSAALKPGMKYAIRADGPEGPRHDFNRDLLLIDPYARGIKRESARETARLEKRLQVVDPFPELVTNHAPLREVLDMVPRVARSMTPVLITGESGTGKELVARAIHRLSERGRGPLVDIACAAMGGLSVETELFAPRARMPELIVVAPV
jgi:hypothetical protein